MQAFGEGKKEFYTRLIRYAVCPECTFYAGGGECRPPEPPGCMMFSFLPELVTLAKIYEKDPEHSPQELMETYICPRCAWEIDGQCAHREKKECCLYRNFTALFDLLRDV